MSFTSRFLMRCLGKIVAVVLAVLWLPLTVHCALETVGVLTPHIEKHGAECGENAHHECGTCDVVEGGDYRVPVETLKVPAPILLAWDDVLLPRLLDLLQESRTVARYDISRDTGEWVADWNFVRRAAGEPRAPALNA